MEGQAPAPVFSVFVMHPQEFNTEARWTVIEEPLDYAKQNWCLVTLKDMKSRLAPQVPSARD